MKTTWTWSSDSLLVLLRVFVRSVRNVLEATDPERRSIKGTQASDERTGRPSEKNAPTSPAKGTGPNLLLGVETPTWPNIWSLRLMYLCLGLDPLPKSVKKLVQSDWYAWSSGGCLPLIAGGLQSSGCRKRPCTSRWFLSYTLPLTFHGRG